MGPSLLLVALLQPSPARADEEAILRVVVNADSKGDFFVVLCGDGDVLLPHGDFWQLGFRVTPAAVERGEKKWVSLKSLPPGVRFRIDEAASTLLVTADPRLLSASAIDLGGAPAAAPSRLEGTTALLNYDFAFRTDDGFRSGSLTVPWEVGIRASDLLLYSGFAYSSAAAAGKVVRLLTNVTSDDSSAQWRLVLGDFTAASGPLGGAGVFAGVSLSKNFSLTPRFVKGPQLGFSGILTTPSDVEVYVNGVLVKKERLPPGEMKVLNVPTVGGAGVATVVIRDAYGREERLSAPFYFSLSMLAPGLHEYGYNLGLRRERTGEESLAYGDLAFLGYHRVGLTRTFTAGLRGEVDRHVVNAGPTATFLVFGAGELDAAAAMSNSGGRTGLAGSLTWSYAGKALGGGASVSALSREYANLGLRASETKPRLAASATLGINNRVLGALSVTWSALHNRAGADSRRIAAAYSRRLLKDLSLYVTAGWTRAETTAFEVFAGLTLGLGERTSLSVSHQSQGSTNRETVQMQQNPPFGTGLGYRFLAETHDASPGERGFSADASVQYKGDKGVYSVDLARIAGRDMFGADVAGGLVFAGGSLRATRPVTDSFAVVEVENVDDTRVYYNNHEMGVARAGKALVVPSLISYDANRISIDDRDVRVDYRIAETARIVTTGWRGGGVVRFEAVRVQAFVGRLLLVEGEKRKPTGYAGLELEVKGRRLESVVGKDGEFYVENLPPGQFAGRLLLSGRECAFQLVVPSSETMVVDLGEVDCEIR